MRPSRLHSRASCRAIGCHASGGFTLVEMVVTVGLLTMLMGILTTVVVTATTAVSVHRTRSELDQKARAVAQVISRDLRQMFIQDEADGWPPKPPVDAGYLCYGEGANFADPDTHLDTDDWIQWTASSPIGPVGAVWRTNDPTSAISADSDPNVPYNARDDGLARAPVYEVAYYLRPQPRRPGYGTSNPKVFILYRRVYLVGPYANRYDPNLHDAHSDVSPWPFRDLDELKYRWGFTTNPNYGPRFDGDGYRPCLAQTSDDTTPWPSPYQFATLANGYTASTYSGVRAGQDVMALDVLSFDVKFWDRRYDDEERGMFVDVGAGSPDADEWDSDGAHASTSYERIFDTWSTTYSHMTASGQVPYSYHYDFASSTGTHGTYGSPPTPELLAGTQFPKAIQIRIRLRDPRATDQQAIRDVTIVVDLMKR